MNLELSDAHQVAESIGEIAAAKGYTIAVAESPTSGSIAMCLGAAEFAAQWFSGGVTAYTPETKYRVRGVTPGRVAIEKAQGVSRLTGADVSVAVTGVGGPETAEGKPARTVFIAVWDGTRARVEEHHFLGAPEAVVEQTVLHALRLLRDALINAADAIPHQTD
ncbi:CinA family protein [Arthrobacter glacialis]|uniref:CinA family protein n=1 Tax=Arthrobacter glacialis TaxID=1664 RepID=A0A2S3ZT39_ARTGL|nr:nicotinamide-nucleotide amidohydrolase family protein [Arthrobacter glacialis]POH72421.1 CinA family protein [Arthrobacter glacialis]